LFITSCIEKQCTRPLNDLQVINRIHPNIKFSKEIEKQQLPLLGFIGYKQEGILSITVYRKPTNTGLYIKWSSLSPLKYKRNIITCLLNRAYMQQLCHFAL